MKKAVVAVLAIMCALPPAVASGIGGQSGEVMAKAGQPSGSSESGSPATVNCHGTHALAVFAEPAGDNIIETLACNESVSVLKRDLGPQGRMAEVRTDGVKDGYVYEAFLDEAQESKPAPEPLTNESIVKLVKAGLGEDTLVSIVQAQQGNYAVAASDIIALKGAGVPDRVIAAMVSGAAKAATPAAEAPSSEAPEVKIPDEPGLYAVASDGAMRHIAGRPTSFTKTGSLLASGLTAGIHARRMNTQIAGKSAYVTVGGTPTFYYRVARNAPDQVVPGTLSLILTRLSVKAGRRQFELDANGILRHSQGISVRHQDNFDAQEIEPGLFQLRPDELTPGQYAFFLYVAGTTENTHSRATTGGGAGGEALRGFLYDFQVE